MGQRANGSMVRRVKGSKARRVNGPKARMAKGSKARMAKGSDGQRLGWPKGQWAKGPEGQRPGGPKARRAIGPSAARRLEAKIVHTFDAHTQLGPPSPRGGPRVCYSRFPTAARCEGFVAKLRRLAQRLCQRPLATLTPAGAHFEAVLRLSQDA